jgi:dihydroorotase
MITRTPSKNSLYVTGAHLLDPATSENATGDLLIEDGMIAAIGNVGSLKTRGEKLGAETLKADGLFLAPGFVDLNCTILEPGSEHTESFATGSSAAAAGGFTSLLLRPLTKPLHDNAFMTDFINRRAKENSKVRIFPMGTLSAGREGHKLSEMGGMAASGVRAVGDDAGQLDSYLMRKGLEYSRAFGLTVMVVPEDKALAGQGVMHEGWNSNRLGLRGIPSAAEEIAVTRDIILARHTQGRLHLQSISTRGAIEAVRQAKAAGLHITCDTNPVYFTLTSDSIATYDANYKVFPPLRSPDDVEAVIEGLADGTIDAIASAHCPQSLASKEQAFEHASAGMISLETTLALTLALVEKKRITPLRMVELLSAAPASVIGAEDLVGSLRPGVSADFVLFDPRASFIWDEKALRSASKNSPFLGNKFNGLVHRTFVGGTLVHESKGQK